MARLAVAVAVVIALAVGVWMLWPDDERGATTTEPLAASTTTSSPTTTEPAPTTTEDDHIVETVAEAEEILREIWFAWFEGIYNQDKDRIREVVVTEEQVEDAVQRFGESEFSRKPESSDISFSGTEILQSDKECVAVWTRVVLTGFREGSSEGVHILRRSRDKWLLHTLWRHRNDLWQTDCA